MNLIKLFRYLNKRDGIFALIILSFIAFQVWLELKLPDYMAEITKLVQTEGSAIDEVLRAGGYMMLCALGSLLSAFLVGFLAAQVAAGLAMRLREGVYHKVMSFTMEEISKFSTSSLITRSTNDITQIQMVVAIGMQVVMRAPIMAIWAIMKISGKSWQWTTATGVAVVLIIAGITAIFLRVIPKFNIAQTLTDSLNRVTRENITGIRVVRAYNAEKYQEDKFAKVNEEVTNTHLFIQKTMVLMQPGMMLIMSTLTLSIYWLGVYMIEAATGLDRVNLFADMVVFSSYAIQVIMAFMMMTMTLIILPRATVSAKRINEVLDTVVKILDGPIDDISKGEEVVVGEASSIIEFKNVSFRYPDAQDDVLKDISFSAMAGETVAFIGSTGSGKSTLINLIPRFYDVSQGEVTVKGINVKKYNQKTLRGVMGYVPQRAILFSGTVKSNVEYGVEASEEAMKKAVKIAQAEEFVMNMPERYDGTIAPGGNNLSGGQKQRLSIARAIRRHPEIYIFDDSFSALDYKTDRALRKALKEEKGAATMLIVAQRIGTIMDADRIIVLDHGRIVGQGTHRELLENCQVYREIAESQLSQEELQSA